DLNVENERIASRHNLYVKLGRTPRTVELPQNAPVRISDSRAAIDNIRIGAGSLENEGRLLPVPLVVPELLTTIAADHFRTIVLFHDVQVRLQTQQNPLRPLEAFLLQSKDLLEAVFVLLLAL